MARSEEELFGIKERAHDELTRIPGVTGVGIGGRVRGGERVQELVLKVYVDKKLPADRLEPSRLIPSEFEGVPTDVSEMPSTGQSAQAPPPPPGKPDKPGMDGRRQRPLVGGCQIHVDMQSALWGTVGCMLVKVGDLSKVYALTNWHLVVGHQGASASSPEIAPTFGETKLGQPTEKDSVTKCCSEIIGKVAAGARDGVRDAAVVQLDPGTQWRADVLEIGAVSGRHTITAAEAATHPQVLKRGARTGLTGGTVDSLGFHATVDGVLFPNTMVLAPNPDPSLPANTPVFFANHGDSGSVIVNGASQVIALYYGVPNPDPPPNPGYHGPVNGWALPIDDVINRFSAQEGLILEVAVAAMPGVTNTVPGAAMVAVPPELAPVLAEDRVLVGGPAEDEHMKVPVAGSVIEPPPPAALAHLQAQLDRSERGRALVTLWLHHQAELLGLVNSNRRVTVVWHRSGASSLFQVLIRMLTQPEITLPRTINGLPLSACVDRLTNVIDRVASAPLRRDLASIRDGLPELGGLTFDGVCSALEAAA